jgi:hypothetical protein
MKRVLFRSIFLLSMVSGSLWAQCSAPIPPPLPDGASANKEDFIEGYQQAKNYLKSGESYLNCLQDEEAAEIEAGTSSEASRTQRLALYNAEVDQMQATGDALNAEVRAFKARGVK